MSCCMMIQAMLLDDRIHDRNLVILQMPVKSLVLTMQGAVMCSFVTKYPTFALDFSAHVLLPVGLVLNWVLFVHWMCSDKLVKLVSGRPRSPVELQDLEVVGNAMHGYEEDFECEDESKHIENND